MQVPSLSVIIPAYNEQNNIEAVLSRTETALWALNLPYEVIVVDDGSTDKTRILVERHKVTLIGNEENRGKGHALRRGLKNACGELVITMDADGSHRPEDIKRLIQPLFNGVDIVMGSRFKGKRKETPTKRINILGNKLFNLLIRILTRRYITDSQTGFRAYKKQVMKQIALTCDGYDVETELTMKSLKNGFIVHEEPIVFERRNSGCSHLNPLRDGLRIFKAIVVAGIKS